MVLTPSSDSHIEMELWLPAADWNGKFQAVGNGGWAGSITFTAMAQALKEGYATASNDTGQPARTPSSPSDIPKSSSISPTAPITK